MFILYDWTATLNFCISQHNALLRQLRKGKRTKAALSLVISLFRSMIRIPDILIKTSAYLSLSDFRPKETHLRILRVDLRTEVFVSICFYMIVCPH